MRALTIRQPWASAIASGDKRVENRSWRPPESLIGQRIAIHVAQRIEAPQSGYPDGWEPPDDMPTGVVIAVATIECVVEDDCDDPWYCGPVGWRLSGVVVLDRHIQCRGALGLWRLPRRVATAIGRQVS